MFSSLPPLFFFALEEKLHNMVWKKKVSFMQREGKHSLYDLSQQIHSTGEKKKETI